MDIPCFIYAITHVESGRRYIGSTVNVTERWIRHKSHLKHNKHHCNYLQNAWNKYGKDTFVFSVIDTLPTNSRKERALLELSHIAASECYNSRTAATGLQNFENSPLTREKITIGIAKAISDSPEFAARLKSRGDEMAAEIRTPEGRKRAGDITKKRWQDPEERKKLYQGLINRWNSPGARERQSEKLKAAKASPEVRAKISARSKATWADPNSKQHTKINPRWGDPAAHTHQANKQKSFWSRPGEKERRSKIMKEHYAKKRAAKLNPLSSS